MKLHLGKKKPGIDFFKRYLNNFVAVSLDTTGEDRPFYASLNLGTILNKAFELELEYSKQPWRQFHLGIGLSLKGDHCGPSFHFALLGFEIEMQIYDCRHWNWEANRFYEPGEEMCLHEARKRDKIPIKPQLDAINAQIEALEEQRDQLLETVKIKECI